ncbi:hypothetical protein HGM15179_021626 [Zosterops borbonicus]|uniref:Uncharacterized protein n=1 Tax=Zosterops borbonicus TaxID=364589 RepID=A0A8K1FXX5_9PASS|nr:hypothetical protein HGM15179_021626 [Zosterops borbonicus]
MRRSISDMNLSTRRRQRKALSLAGPGDPGDGATPAPGPPGASSGTPPDGGTPPGEGGAGLELLSQCLIRPPSDRPYFVLVRGYHREDFVLYIMTRPQHIFGRAPERARPETPPPTPDTPPEGPQPQKPPQKPPGPPKADPLWVVDTFLSAPDILPRHCLVQAGPGPGGDPSGDPPPSTVRPFRGAPVTLNGTPVPRRAPLSPGDLLGLGEHVLLLYKDPRLGEGARPPWLPPPRPLGGLLGVLGCAGCGRSPREVREVLRGALETPKAELRYRAQDEETLLRAILGLPGDPGGSPGDPGDTGDSSDSPGGPPEEDLGALAPAFLLGLCLDHAAREFPAGHLPELLGRVAALLRETVWEKIKEIGDRQPER